MKPLRKIDALLLVSAFMLAGCTGTTVKPSLTRLDVAKTYSTVVVGDIVAPDELWHNYAIEIHRALADQLVISKAFSQVLDPAPVPIPSNAVLVSGRIAEVDKGNAAARWIVGFGAGRAHITAEFQLVDGAGTQIGTYSVRKTYAGGAGIGGASFLDLDDLATKLGEASADSLADWAKTGKFAKQ